MNKHRMAVSSY